MNPATNPALYPQLYGAANRSAETAVSSGGEAEPLVNVLASVLVVCCMVVGYLMIEDEGPA